MTSSGDVTSRLRPRNASSSLHNYLELMRLPNVFTAMADVAMGFLFVQPQGWIWTPWPDGRTLGLLLIASTLLYLSGIVLNDVFDLDIDRRERPERPIPSGRVSRRAAARLGWMLLMTGVVFGIAASLSVGHARPAVVAVLLAGAIVLYDAWLKRTAIGPVSMGACRLCNVLLGISAVSVPLTAEYWIVAGGIGVYVTGVTWFARRESERSSQLQLAAALLVMFLGIAMLASLPHWCDRMIRPLYFKPQGWYMLTGALGMLIGWRCFRAVADPSPARVKMAVGQCVLSIITLDSVACYSVRGIWCATGILLLLLPAFLFGRRISVT